MNLLDSQCSQKCSYEIDFSFVTLSLDKRKNAGNQRFFSIRSERTPYFTSVKITCLRNFGEYFFN